MIQPNDFVVKLRLSVERVFEKYKSFKSLLVKFEELYLASNLIQKADEQIKNHSEKLKRIISGLKDINKILTEDSRENIVSLFSRRMKKKSVRYSLEFTRLKSLPYCQ